MNLEITNIEGNCFGTASNVYDIYSKSKDAEIFEQLIDDLILTKYTDDQDLIDFIKDLELDEKRIAILALIDGDHALWSKMDAYVGGCSNKMEHIKNVVKIINQFVKDGEVEKKKFGEVMTPITLVREMLDTLPAEVWSNPNLKWLDPANGAGTFPFVIIYKLMKGLSEWEPDTEKRYKHIVENMIYVCELQSRNVFLWLCGVDPKDEYTTNTYWGSFLEEDFNKHMKEVWNVDKFDIVVGNPPYNTGTSGGNGARDLWDKFVLKSIDTIIEDNGFLIFVHPSKWRSPENEILNIFKKNNLIYLEIHSDKDGYSSFGAITRYDFYCLQKSKYNGNTKIVDEKGIVSNINILDWEWIPNYNFESISSLISTDYEKNCEVIYSSSIYDGRKEYMSMMKDKINNLPCVYGMYKDHTCSYRYSSIDRGHFGIPKVILGIGRYLYPLIDIDGEFGIMNNAFGIKIYNNIEGLNIKKAIESEKFKEIIKATKWSNFQTNYKMFKSFKNDFWKEFI